MHTVLLSGGRHVLYISAVLPAPPEDVAVTCAFDMEAFLYSGRRRAGILLAGAAVFAVLAAALYVVLRGLSRPMERLASGRAAGGRRLHGPQPGAHAGRGGPACPCAE
ncbi:MAG: hypothetical protein ACLRZH_10275 [Ruthenibacterium lactatiformans]